MFREDTSYLAQVPGEVEYPYENYFVAGPNPAPGLETAATMSPTRSHAPIVRERPWYRHEDAANPDIQRIPGDLVPIPVKELPYTPRFVPSSGWTTPYLAMAPGWKQAFVPEAGRRVALAAQTPLLQLSAPIRSYSRVNSVSEPKRPLTKVRAPKAKS